MDLAFTPGFLVCCAGTAGPGASQIARLTAAAVFSYLVANAYSPGILDLTAPLTALLVV